jgi:alanine-synthesizing transaminase
MGSGKPIRAARRTANVRYAVRDIVILAKEAEKAGKELLYLNIGDPNQFDFETPRPLIDAATKAMLDNHCGYSPSNGIPVAVDSIRRYAESKGIRNIQDVFVTTGGSEAIELTLTSLVDEGENVLTPAPGYPLYTAIIPKIGAIENPYYLSEENDWQPDLEDIRSKVNDKTRAIVLINPNNPTGSNNSREFLEGVVRIALEHDLVILADEIYDKLLFDGQKHISIASLNPDCPVVTFCGLAKNYAGPGWRIGWGIVSGPKGRLADLIEAINKLLRARLCANHPLQYAIPAALDGDDAHLPGMIAKLERRRDLTFQMLNDIDGISCVKPGGAFYAFPKLEIDVDDAEFVHDLILETGVVVVPGSGFGEVPGTRHMRIVFLPPEQILEKAYRQIGEFMKKYR